jgi:hypothetical protein
MLLFGLKAIGREWTFIISIFSTASDYTSYIASIPDTYWIGVFISAEIGTKIGTLLQYRKNLLVQLKIDWMPVAQAILTFLLLIDEHHWRQISLIIFLFNAVSYLVSFAMLVDFSKKFRIDTLEGILLIIRGILMIHIMFILWHYLSFSQVLFIAALVGLSFNQAYLDFELPFHGWRRKFLMNSKTN